MASAIQIGILLFLLPHAEWIPRKLNIPPDNIPLGITNIILLFGLIFLVTGILNNDNLRNPFGIYTLYIIVVIIGILIALNVDFGNDVFYILRSGKDKISLMMLYFIPLAIFRENSDFKPIFWTILFVNIIIGVEIFRSGELGGPIFSDSKRGSGPFGVGYLGSDIAGAYLSQIIMYYFALLFFKEPRSITKILVLLGSMIVFLGILATYSRGALVGLATGLFFMLFTSKSKIRSILSFCILIILLLMLMPKSTMDRINKTTNDDGTLDFSSVNRVEFLKATINIAKDYPFGIGTGQIQKAMPKYMSKLKDDHVEGDPFDTHNSFTYTLCEFGVVGLIIFILMLMKLFKSANNILNCKRVPIYCKVYAMGFIGMIGAFISCNMFYGNYYKNLVLGTISIHFGLIAYITTKYSITRYKNE